MGGVDTLQGRHLVVTGFTGFLAKVLVALLLDRVPGIGRITLLVRPRGRLQPALARVERIVDTSPAFRPLRERHGPRLAEWLGARLDAVDADVERPLCGLDAEALERLASADAVVHCAGLTDFEPDPVKALATNVAGSVNAGQLAERLRVPLIHVSTCYAAGAPGLTAAGAPGAVEKAVVPERVEAGVAPSGARFDVGAEVRALQLACRAEPELAGRVRVGLERARALGWPNIYTYTKGLAEHLLAQRPGLDLTIVRPSIVECARTFPFPGWNEGLNTAGPLAWLISTAFRRLPTVPDHTFDVVPVDDTAKGLAAITAAAIEGRAGGLFHLASSDHRPLTFERAVELTGLGMRRWTRKGGGTALDRALFRWLDPIPVAADAPGPFSFDHLRAAARWLAPLSPAIERRAEDAETQMARIEKMLALYRPFIHDNDWEFRTDRVRALTAGDPDFRFDLSDLDWCRYWVDVEYPGLRKWCIPIIDGVKIPGDPPSSPAFRLARPEEWAGRVASK